MQQHAHSSGTASWTVVDGFSARSSPSPHTESPTAPPVVLVLFGCWLVMVWILFLATRATHHLAARTEAIFHSLSQADRAWLTRRRISWPLRRAWRDYRVGLLSLGAPLGFSGFALYRFQSELLGRRQLVMVLVLSLVSGTLFVRHLVRVARLERIRQELNSLADAQNS